MSLTPMGSSERYVLWVELCSLEKYVEVLTPSTCDCDFIWKSGLGRWNQDKMRLLILGLNPKLLVSLQKEEDAM